MKCNVPQQFLVVVLFCLLELFSVDVVVYPALFVVMVLLVAAEVLLVLAQPCLQHKERAVMAQLDKKLGY